jgi:Tfp pilus assembly protein PilO
MNRRIAVISLAAMLGLTAIWYVLLWSPQSASLKHSRANAATAVQQEQTLRGQLAALILKRAKLPAAQAQLATLARAVPKTAEVDKLIDDVNGLAKSSGVFLDSLSQAQPAITGGAGSMNVTLSVNGSYPQLVDFINRFTTMARLAVIDGVSFTAPDKDAKMSLSLTGRVFLVAPPAAVVPGATTATTAVSH